jgi:hypothetical protein
MAIGSSLFAPLVVLGICRWAQSMAEMRVVRQLALGPRPWLSPLTRAKAAVHHLRDV